MDLTSAAFVDQADFENESNHKEDHESCNSKNVLPRL